MKHHKKRKKSNNLNYLFGVIAILIIIVLTLLFLQSNTFKELTSEHKTIKIQLKDECSLMFKNIIHRIKTEGNCDSLCKNECTSQDIQYERVEFSKEENSCNSCTCYCKK